MVATYTLRVIGNRRCQPADCINRLGELGWVISEIGMYIENFAIELLVEIALRTKGLVVFHKMWLHARWIDDERIPEHCVRCRERVCASKVAEIATSWWS